MADLRCSGCGAPLPFENLDRRLAVARCGHCNGITDISEASLMRAGRAEVPLPEGVSLEREGDHLRIVRAWFAWNKLAGLVAVPIAIVFVVQMMGEGPRPASFDLFLGAFVAMGAASAYAAVANIINRTEVTVDRRQLKVRHWPLPWLPMPTIPVTSIEQLYCHRREVTRKKSVRIFYEVVAVLRNGRSVRLVRNLDSMEQAHFLEQEIERKLGVLDRAVGSEVL
jgi:hypothetical protein